MPVIPSTTSADVAFDITAPGNYFLAAPDILESTNGNAVGFHAGTGRVGLSVAGTVISPLNFYALCDSGITTEITLNVLASGYISAGGILSTARKISLTNAGMLFGIDAGIQTGSSADQIVNIGTIC